MASKIVKYGGGFVASMMLLSIGASVAMSYQEAKESKKRAQQLESCIKVAGESVAWKDISDNAESICKIAADNNPDNVEALIAYGKSLDKLKKYSESFDLYKRAAEMGDQQGQLSLGNAYYSGHGVAKDYAQSIYWYKQSASQGNIYAMEMVGLSYEEGKGVGKNINTALQWYNKSGTKYSLQQISIIEYREAMTRRSGSNSGICNRLRIATSGKSSSQRRAVLQSNGCL